MSLKNPEGWCYATLNDIARSVGGGTPSKSDPTYWDDGTVSWVSPKDMKVFDLRSSEDSVSQKALERLTLIPVNSILVVVRSGILSRILPIAINHIQVTINQDMRAFVLGGEINARFIAWQLQASQQDILAKCSKDGTTVASIEASALTSFSLVLPPLNEQHRIVAKIEELFSELDQGIENLKTAQAQLKVYRQALLKHAFEGKLTAQWREQNRDQLDTAAALQQRIQQERAQRYQQQLAEWEANGKQGSKPKAPKPLPPLSAEELAELPELPEGWIWCKLGDFISSIDAGKSFKCDEREPRADEIGVAKVSAVTWGEYDESESKTCTDSSKENKAYLIRSGDFLLSRANTIDLVAACVIARKVTKKIMLSDKTLRIVFEGFSQEYFLQYLRSRTGRNQIMQLSTGNQESMRNIGQDRIRSIAVPICSEVEASAVIEVLASHMSEVDQLDQTLATSLQQAEALRQSILKKAFSGQLVAQDSRDEPASALLARIRAERETKKTRPKP